MGRVKGGITNIDSIVASLVGGERERLGRIFKVITGTGQLRPPVTMNPWLAELFGSVDNVVEQRIVRVTNLVTLEETLYNRLRSNRPMSVDNEPVSPDVKADIFNDPISTTPEDVFGRVEGKYCITASNVAKYESFHSVIIFHEPDPLRFTREQVIDYIDTGWRWAQKAHDSDPDARYFFFMWNCGERAGASQAHGHAQVVLGRVRHYAKVEHLRSSALSYRSKYGSSYFEDLYLVHRSMGCGFENNGVRVLAYLTPVKEKETILMDWDLSRSLKESLYEVLACFRDRMSVTSFNVAIFMPPLGKTDEDWGGFPAMVRVVDRGDSRSSTSDIGAVELYGSNVVSGDPFEVAGVLKEALTQSVK